MIIRKIKASLIVFTTFPSSLLSNVLSAVKQSCDIKTYPIRFISVFTLSFSNPRRLKQIARAARILLFLLSFGFCPWVLASNSCLKIYLQPQSANPNLSIQNAFKTWLRWEQLYNLPEYQRSVFTMPLQASPIAKENFSVQYFSADSKNNLHDFIFSSDNFINWYKHPTNTAATVPYFSAPAVGTHIKAETTASRSLSFQWNKALYSIKLATNHPHEGKYAVDKKASVQEDILLARSRSPYINQTEDLIGTDKDISIVKELAVVVDQKTNEGYIVRDLSFLLTPDRFYLPAFSIPYAATELGLSAKSQDRFAFWQQHYAQALGQAKAKLLLRYGLQMETPNPQNILIELDQNYKPTGRIMFRDISDMSLVRAVAFAFGARKQLAIDLKNGIRNADFLDPNTELSFLFFDRSESEPSWSKKNLIQWTQAHNQSYILEIEQTLQLDLSEIKQTGNFQRLYQLLQSPEGQDKLRQYRQKQIALHNEQNQAEHSKHSNSTADDASKARAR